MPTIRGSGAPVLLVEDDPELRDALALVLQSAGYAVVTAGDGVQALDRLHDALRPRLVVLDLMLPVMDGFEFRVRQMEDPELAGIPVIVLSAGGDLTRKTVTMHPAACLMKPIEMDELLAHVRRIYRSAPDPEREVQAR